MNLCLVTAHTASYAELAALTEPNKLAFATAHGHDFRSCILTSDHPTYERLEWLLWTMILPDSDWYWWTDTDSLITNKSFAQDAILSFLMKSDADLIISKDANGLNSGSFLLRDTDASCEFIRKIVSNRGEFDGQSFPEQRAMEKYIGDIKVQYVPQRVMNSYDYTLLEHLGGNYAKYLDADGNDGQWQSGDLLIHWPGIDMEKRLALAKEYLGKVVT